MRGCRDFETLLWCFSVPESPALDAKYGVLRCPTAKAAHSVELGVIEENAISCLLDEFDDALAVDGLSWRECFQRKTIIWSESKEEHDRTTWWWASSFLNQHRFCCLKGFPSMKIQVSLWKANLSHEPSISYSEYNRRRCLAQLTGVCLFAGKGSVSYVRSSDRAVEPALFTRDNKFCKWQGLVSLSQTEAR